MKKRFAILVILSAVLFVLAAHFLPIYYEDNDDATMAWIASGTYSGQPDCHLQYINAVYGCFLTALYFLTTSIEWYSVLFSIFQIISFAVICLYILKSFDGNRLLVILAIMVAVCIWLWLIARFQFTTTAALLAFSATLLLLDKRFWAGGVLLLIASAIRFPAAGLVGLVMMPAFFYVYRWKLRRCWLPLALVLSAVMALHVADDLFYKSAEWAKYREFDSCRGKINDNPNAWRARGHLPDGMADFNYEWILAYFVDPGAVSNEEMKQIVSYLFNEVPVRKKLKSSFQGCFLRYWVYFLFVFVVLLPASLLVKDKQFKRMVFIAFAIWFAALSLVGFNCSVKNRVFTSSFIPMIFYIFAAASLNVKQGKWILASTICSAMFLFCMFEYAIPAIKRGPSLEDKAVKFAEQLQLVNSVEGYSVVTRGGDFSVEMLDPFAMSNVIKPHVFINPYCYMGSPLNNDRLASHLDLVNDNICMFSRKDCADFEGLKKAIMTNYDVAVDTIHLKESDNYLLVKFVKTEQNAVE